MTEKTIEILTPVGRLVAGDCFRGNDKDATGNPLLIKNGPNAGKPRLDYYIGIAIAKTDPAVNELLRSIHSVAAQSFPQLFDANGGCLSPTFAFKYVDGDSQIPNRRGVKPCDKTGYPGHYVFSFSSGFAPRCYAQGGTSQIVDENAIKRGYYIRISGTCRGNESLNQPGVFLNHSMVEFVAYGDEIRTGPDPTAVFGSAPVAQLPAGATTAPPTPTVSIAAPGAVPAGLPPQAAPGAVPATDFLDPTHRYMYQGQEYTAEQLRGFGWTDQQIHDLDKIPF